MNAVSAIEPWEGKVVEGKYPLLELLGSGRRGPVFRTQFTAPNGQQGASIKLIPVEPKNAEAEISRLRSVMALSHPHLIKILDVGQCEIRRQPNIYVVTELAEENLAQVLPSRALTPGEVEQMLPPLIEALSYLHRNGFVHGSIQASNVMAVADTLRLSSDSARKIETPSSPDQPEKYVTGNGSDSATPSDIRALGALLVAALAPETRGQPSEQQLTLIPSSVPEPFRRIASECLRPNPGDRCTLDQIRGMLTSTPDSPDRALAPVITKGRRLVNTVGIPLLIIAVLFSFPLLRSYFRPKPKPGQLYEIVVNSSDSVAPAVNKGTVPGAVAERVQPNVSQGARNTIQGKIRVALRLAVDSAGNVTDARLTTPGPSKYFANQALQSARKWKFMPPKVDGQPTSSAWLLKYQFGRGGTEISPSQIH